MATDWQWRIYLFVRAIDATAQNKAAIAQIYVDNGSGETLANELKMFDTAVRLSASGAEPAQAFGINLTAKISMRDAFKAILDTLTDARYAVVANTTLQNFAEGELVLTNWPGVTPNGQIVTWQDALDRIEQEFGLIVIPDPDPFTEEQPLLAAEPEPVEVVESIAEPEPVAVPEPAPAIIEPEPEPEPQPERPPDVQLFGRTIPLTSDWTWRQWTRIRDWWQSRNN